MEGIPSVANIAEVHTSMVRSSPSPTTATPSPSPDVYTSASQGALFYSHVHRVIHTQRFDRFFTLGTMSVSLWGDQPTSSNNKIDWNPFCGRRPIFG